MDMSDEQLQKHDEWARSAVELVHSLTAVQQHNLLLHLFRSVAHIEQTDDRDAATKLVHDLAATIDLRESPRVRAALDSGAAVKPDDTVELDEAIKLLSSL